MRFFSKYITAALLMAALPAVSGAEVRSYRGTMQVLEVSGKACQNQLTTLPIQFLLNREQNGSGISGYFWGDGIATGRFSGDNAARLDVRYPYQDELKAGGHAMGIDDRGANLVADLRDRHIEADVNDCNFDLARMELSLTGDGNAQIRFDAVAARYDAQLAQSRGAALVREGNHADAVPLFEQALSRIESAGDATPQELASYITSLASVYLKSGRGDDFARLFDKRYFQISDESAKAVLGSYRIRQLLQSGRDLLRKEEYQAAQEVFERAYSLAPQSREAVAAIMMVHMRTGRHDSAIAFLEKALKTMESETGRQEVRMALANIYLQRAKKYDKDGKTAEAEADLKRADKLDPHSVQYIIALARLRHKAGDPAGAEKLLQQGLERFKLVASRQEIMTARDRMRQTEAILKKLRKAGS